METVSILTRVCFLHNYLPSFHMMQKTVTTSVCLLCESTPSLTSPPANWNQDGGIMSPRCVTNKEEQWGGREVVGELSGCFPVTSEWRDNRSVCDSVWRGGERRDLRCGRRRLADVTVIIVWKWSDVGMTQSAFCLGSNWRNVWRK